MNLEYAAYLLNENMLLTEDADSTGQKSARAWIAANLPNMEFAETMTADEIKEQAQAKFGHPLNTGLAQRVKGIYKFLMGAVRIAIDECGWLTEHEDTKMMDNLVLMYAAAFFEWKDGIAAGLPGPQQGQQYGGKYDKNLNGLTYSALYAELRSKLPETAERLRAQTAALATAHEETEEERAEREAREAEERERNSRAGEYHIEYIPNFTESHKWYKYTNPQSTRAGCHWCITQEQGYWDSYARQRPGRTIYFCWKGESLEALMAMNRDQRWFRDWDGPMSEAPFNEYGLSLICIQVDAGPDGSPVFNKATSRYNHVNPHNEWDGEGNHYGDALVRPESREGFEKILQILGITEDEFKQKFKIRSGEGIADHTPILAALAQYTTNSNGRSLTALLNTLCDDVENYHNNIIQIRHQQEYNFVNSDAKLLSPRWFNSTSGSLSERGVLGVRFRDNNNRNVWNIMDISGNFMLAKNVDSLETSDRGNYVKFKIITNDGSYKYNIINTKTGSILLKHPVYNIYLADNYYNNIPIKETEDSPWTLVDLKGKKINIDAALKDIYNDHYDISSNGKTLLVGRLTNNKYVIINKKNGKVVYKLKNNERVYSIIDSAFIIRDDSYREDVYKAYDLQGNLLITNTHFSIRAKDTSSNYLFYKDKNKDNKLIIYDINARSTIEPDDGRTTNDLDYIYSYKNIFTLGHKYLYANGECVIENLYNGKIDSLPSAFGNCVLLNITNEEGDSKLIAYNIDTNEQIDLPFTSIIYKKNNYIAGLAGNSRNRKLIILDTDFNEILTFTHVNNTVPLNFDCILVSFNIDEPAKYNIVNDVGHKMFDKNFTELLTPGFTADGVAQIKSGNNEYYINLDGDISRVLETIAESSSHRNNGPLLMEYFKHDSKKTWHDIAAMYLD